MGILKHTISILLLFCSVTLAQLSPGDLAEPHKDLEGITNCTSCHELGEGPSASKCLECHRTLQNQIKDGKGYHYKIVHEEGKICFSCHSDHAGRDFDLIRWPDKINTFDHNLTGYSLKGKHKEQDCRDCHHPGNIVDDLKLNNDLSIIKTFLGLQQDCLSCHTDEHRNQLSKDCLNCHSEDGWRKNNTFSHNKAKFKLTGKHITIDCSKCHPTVIDNTSEKIKDTTFIQYIGLKYSNCTSCHKDIHTGKFGSDCQRCHVTTGWKVLDERNVDHSKTNFPLLGKHTTVKCDKCHKPNVRFINSQYDACVDCHSDTHYSQFASYKNGGACEGCHTVNGFLPSLFGITAHNEQTEFKLVGAHLAQPCIVCHKTTETDNGIVYRLFTSQLKYCADCHIDIHLRQFSQSDNPKTCDNCHNVNRWKPVQFDHDKDSNYPLKGAHKKVACSECHKTKINGTEKFIKYKPLETTCRSCHDKDEKNLKSLDS
ncbi:cytochrome c3 family protein [Candidatus Zixiibacteriota bacterium]